MIQNNEIVFDPEVPEIARQFILACLNRDPGKRPTANQALNSQFLTFGKTSSWSPNTIGHSKTIPQKILPDESEGSNRGSDRLRAMTPRFRLSESYKTDPLLAQQGNIQTEKVCLLEPLQEEFAKEDAFDPSGLESPGDSADEDRDPAFRDNLSFHQSLNKNNLARSYKLNEKKNNISKEVLEVAPSEVLHFVKPIKNSGDNPPLFSKEKPLKIKMSRIRSVFNEKTPGNSSVSNTSHHVITEEVEYESLKEPARVSEMFPSPEKEAQEPDSRPLHQFVYNSNFKEEFSTKSAQEATIKTPLEQVKEGPLEITKKDDIQSSCEPHPHFLHRQSSFENYNSMHNLEPLSKKIPSENYSASATSSIKNPACESLFDRPDKPEISHLDFPSKNLPSKSPQKPPSIASSVSRPNKQSSQTTHKIDANNLLPNTSKSKSNLESNSKSKSSLESNSKSKDERKVDFISQPGEESQRSHRGMHQAGGLEKEQVVEEELQNEGQQKKGFFFGFF